MKLASARPPSARCARASRPPRPSAWPARRRLSAAAQARSAGLEEKLAEAREAESVAERELGEAQEHLAELDG